MDPIAFPEFQNKLKAFCTIPEESYWIIYAVSREIVAPPVTVGIVDVDTPDELYILYALVLEL